MSDYPRLNDRYRVLVPVEVTDGVVWGVGEIVRVSHVLDGSNGYSEFAGVELEDAEGFASQFSQNDIDGEYGWFERIG